MNKKVFIKQDGTIPGYRIIGELERRGAINRINLIGDEMDAFYYINSRDIIDVELCLCKWLEDRIELLYNKETDSFYEKSQRMVSAEAKEAILPDFKTVTDYADDYVGHPQEIDEDLSVYQKREAYKAGMNKAFELILRETYSNREAFIWSPVVHISKFIDKMKGKEVEK